MTEQEFYQGWSMLLAEPSAGIYTFGPGAEQREAEQIRLYQSRFMHLPGWRWITACQRWVETGNHWPTITELYDAMNTYAPMPATTNSKSPALPESDDENLPRRAYLFATQHDMSITEAVKKLVPTWLQENPGHPDRERAEALLASLDTKPIPLVKQMPTLEESKYEWSAGLSATACAGKCTFCQEERGILICWCGREGCRHCLGEHQPNCPTGSIVNSI
jgi:hypothetical protein